MSESCAFCAIARGDASAHLVHRDGETFSFLDRSPLLPGHVLVATLRHVETFDDLPPELIEPLFAVVRRLSIAVQAALEADGSFVAVNTRISQSVPHVHVHVVPRRRNDGLFSPKLIWRRRPYASEPEAASIAARIRTAYERPAPGGPPG
ncbi:MAG TPA: HIT domain-containing protein [Candidatus Limnocylindria bacterium]